MIDLLTKAVFLIRLPADRGLRKKESEVVMARKQRIYAQRLGYDLIGDNWQQHQKGRTGGRFPST